MGFCISAAIEPEPYVAFYCYHTDSIEPLQYHSAFILISVHLPSPAPSRQPALPYTSHIISHSSNQSRPRPFLCINASKLKKPIPLQVPHKALNKLLLKPNAKIVPLVTRGRPIQPRRVHCRDPHRHRVKRVAEGVRAPEAKVRSAGLGVTPVGDEVGEGRVRIDAEEEGCLVPNRGDSLEGGVKGLLGRCVGELADVPACFVRSTFVKEVGG